MNLYYTPSDISAHPELFIKTSIVQHANQKAMNKFITI